MPQVDAPSPAVLTDRQRRWFASVAAGLERDTGRTLAEWAELARACPETAPRKRLAWMKAQHGLGQNHASLVLNAAFPAKTSWSTPDLLADALWRDPGQREVFEAVRQMATALPDVVTGQRKGFTAFSRRVQFAAVKPAPGGLLLGLALEPAHDPRLAAPPRSVGWSERLKAALTLDAPNPVDASIVALLRAAWDRS